MYSVCLLAAMLCCLPIVTAKLGTTLRLQAHYPEFGVDVIGCDGCNPYKGDTDCNTSLPIICTKRDFSPRPPYPMICRAHAMTKEFYCGWNQGHVATTMPVKASQFKDRAEVDAFCALTFGQGWQAVNGWQIGWYIVGMNGLQYSGAKWTANAHLMQNGGWSVYSYGHVRNDTRFWHHALTNCWLN